MLERAVRPGAGDDRVHVVGRGERGRVEPPQHQRGAERRVLHRYAVPPGHGPITSLTG